MKRTEKILLSAAVVATAGLVVYLALKTKSKRMLTQVANEGYETAHDILYPNKHRTHRKLKYGPVIPETMMHED